MVHKTLFASAPLWILFQLWCLSLVVKYIGYTEEQFERFLLDPIPEQHPSFPPPFLGSSSAPESAASTSKDHLRSTFPSPWEKEVEGNFQIESPEASQRYAPLSNSLSFTLDDNILDKDVSDYFSNRSPLTAFHVGDRLSSDMRSEHSTQEKDPFAKVKKEKIYFAKSRSQTGVAKFWKSCTDPGARLAWTRYWDRTGHRVFLQLAARAFREETSLKSGKSLQSVIYQERFQERPPTWHNSIIDHPTTLVEERQSFRKDQSVHILISEWAQRARNELAEKRELRYMQKLAGSEKWILKPLESRRVEEGPDRWRSKEKANQAEYGQQFARANEDHLPHDDAPTNNLLPHVQPPGSLPSANSRLVDHRFSLDTETERSLQTKARKKDDEQRRFWKKVEDKEVLYNESGTFTPRPAV
ncbi:hypothetical protein FA10DRAFT_258313 [Acaromyces ingoldii]|uniref:Uncharacterized protein n=1 Tax=Acaromyces ingoldii TaxID=215250 RepID=A0A316YYB6_9BASI|nr:hypothetical protein FA10DRAFT_258313 [Acaromyces ingoldii]PWN94181.1 hypothetical protein FA10DRAFT_258313 [Acaromyces ingoldii]